MEDFYSIKIIVLFLTLITPVLVGVIILTLLERKLMASVQRREGPNKVGFFGLTQSVADALKLIRKEKLILRNISFFIFLFSPVLSLLLSLMQWLLLPSSVYGSSIHFDCGIFLFFSIASVNVLSVLLSGWSSNSNYAFLGSIRSVALMISYEVYMGCSLLPIILINSTLNLDEISYQVNFIFQFFCYLPFFIIYFVSVLSETNRAPFDLAEAEAELVAGFNVEYSGPLFMFFFLSEYLNILFVAQIIIIFFFNPISVHFKWFFILVKNIYLIFFFKLVNETSFISTISDIFFSFNWWTVGGLNFFFLENLNLSTFCTCLQSSEQYLVDSIVTNVFLFNFTINSLAFFSKQSILFYSIFNFNFFTSINIIVLGSWAKITIIEIIYFLSWVVHFFSLELVNFYCNTFFIFDDNGELIFFLNSSLWSLLFSFFFYLYKFYIIFGIDLCNFFSFSVFSVLVIFLILHVRATYPRFRYDHLILASWKGFLPILLSYLVFILSFNLYFIL